MQNTHSESVRQSWIRAGLFGSGSSSGRIRAMIFKFFRADIQHVNAKYFLSFLLIFLLYCLSESVFCRKHSFGLFFLFCNNGIEQHRIICRPISHTCTLFRAEIGLLILSSCSDSGYRVRAEKTRPRPTLQCESIDNFSELFN